VGQPRLADFCAGIGEARKQKAAARFSKKRAHFAVASFAAHDGTRIWTNPTINGTECRRTLHAGARS